MLVDHVLCGRMKGVGLDSHGNVQAKRLADALSGKSIDLIQSSPRLRAQQTARPIAQRLGLALETTEGFDELDAGEWTGLSFQALKADPRWREWNTRRGSARPPGGESMAELQARVVAHLNSLRHRSRELVVIVSHAEPIRAAILHYRHMSLDRFSEVSVEPASITVLQLDPLPRAAVSIADAVLP
jgi:broad specificity phosphatase PhoE